jgi:hypothetical protein
MAGACGVSLSGLTYGQLVELYGGRRRHDWAIAAEVMCVTANSALMSIPNRKIRRAFRVTDFLPADLRREMRPQRRGMTRGQLRAMKPMFTDSRR